eukprot:TRINITY_DN10421_c0_g1_i3.p1 TRINITY_DN10421_c0_g1~~TRINITY_DN10421_c0_g1_i3.p1  ORF type:complete len:190 (+),score=33.16 TRINITY_DN10421_c0_g1_i3:57-626(+)
MSVIAFVLLPFFVGANAADCTYTQGYWKNHQSAWPAGTNSILLCSELYIDTLNAAPAGNEWYILAHQYIAAKLNVENGAIPSAAIQADFNQAEVLLATCDKEGSIVAKKFAVASQATDLADSLASWNEGDAGTPHCDDLSNTDDNDLGDTNDESDDIECLETGGGPYDPTCSQSSGANQHIIGLQRSRR